MFTAPPLQTGLFLSTLPPDSDSTAFVMAAVCILSLFEVALCTWSHTGAGKAEVFIQRSELSGRFSREFLNIIVTWTRVQKKSPAENGFLNFWVNINHLLTLEGGIDSFQNSYKVLIPPLRSAVNSLCLEMGAHNVSTDAMWGAHLQKSHCLCLLCDCNKWEWLNDLNSNK